MLQKVHEEGGHLEYASKQNGIDVDRKIVVICRYRERSIMKASIEAELSLKRISFLHPYIRCSVESLVPFFSFSPRI
jgi:rhodanese-related sulfurtransferase